MTKDVEAAWGGTQEKMAPEDEKKDTWAELNLTMDKRIDLALTGVFILVGAFMVIVARKVRLGSQPDWFTSRGFPILAGGLLILEGVALAAIRLITWSKLPGNCVPEEGQEDEKGYPVSWVRCMLVILLSFMWEWFLIPLGLLIVTPLYLILCLWVMGERSWVILIVFSIIFTLANWITFGPLLGIRFPLGPLTNFLYSLGLA